MEMLVKGMIIGMIVCIPIGPLGIMSIQRTINNGWKVGFFSGLGAATSDIVYALCAVFGFSFIDEVLHKHKYLINEVTGVMFLVVGINIFMNALENKIISEDKKKFVLHPGLSNFLLGLSNPMTFLIFLTIFTRIGIKFNTEEIMQNLMFVVSIFIGSMIFWFVTSNLINKFKRNFKIETFCLVDKIIGISITLLGAFSIFKGIWKV